MVTVSVVTRRKWDYLDVLRKGLLIAGEVVK
jgi:hypothetical protein